MGLMNNYFRVYYDGIVEGSAHALLPNQWQAYRQFEKFIYPDMGTVLTTAANPPGFYIPNVYHPPITAGEMSLRIDGSGGLSANLYPAMLMSVDLTGSGSLSAIGALVVSMAVEMTGSGDLNADIQGIWDMYVDMEGSGTLDADIHALGNMLIDLTGTGDLDAAIAAVASMSIDIVVTGTGLSVANVGAAVWDALATENNDAGTMGELLNNSGAGGNPWDTAIDGTYTAADVMKIVAAALAGKATGGGTTSIALRDLSDTKDVVTMTVDVDGNRSSVVLDP